MLGIAISSFFALALFGSITVIALMFAQYRDRIASVIESELGSEREGAAIASLPYRHRTVKAPQLMNQHRSLQPAPLRAAA